jgi:predicted RNase H-like HicB family nuclease
LPKCELRVELCRFDFTADNSKRWRRQPRPALKWSNGFSAKRDREKDPMTTHAVKLKVIAGVPEDCSFWLEDDGWNGVCEDLSVKVRGSSFEDAKTKMEAALQTHIESVLRKHSRKSGKRVA